MSLPVPTEAQEADVLVAYLRRRSIPFTHIPNETGHTMEARRRAVRMKRQGVSRGFPDYIVVLRKRVIAIELKRQRGSKTSPEQTAWVETLNDSGMPTAICRGAVQAIAFIEEQET